MNNIHYYSLSLQSQAKGLGTCPAVWFALGMNSNDRTPEIRVGSEGAGYA